MFGRDTISVLGKIGGTSFSYNNGMIGASTSFGNVGNGGLNYTYSATPTNYNYSALQTVNTTDANAKAELLNGIYNNILIVNENKDLLGRLAFIMNSNLYMARKAEVIEIIHKLVATSAKYALNITAEGYNGDQFILGLANRINQGLQLDAANLGLDWRIYSNPLTGADAIDTISVPTLTPMGSVEKPAAQAIISGTTNGQLVNHSNKINDAVTKLKKLVTDLGFTDMDNPKKLKKFWDSNFVPKYKKLADVPFADILAALQ